MKPGSLRMALCVACAIIMLEAQAPGWFKAVGSPYEDYGKHGLQMDGHYFLIGTHARDSVKDDIWLVKANSDGDTLWTAAYSFTLFDNMGLHMQKSLDGGLFIAGGVDSDSNNWDAVFMKVDTSGNLVQSFFYGNSNSDWAEQVCATDDGGCVLTGVTFSYGNGFSDIFLIRMNSGGDTMWAKTYGGGSHDQGFAVKQAPDSGFIMAGWNGPDNYHARVALVKTDKNGNEQWSHYWGGTSGESKAMDVCLTADGGYLVAGYTNLYGAGSNDAWLLKVNPSGDTVWTKTFGGSGSDFLYSIGPAADGNFVMVGGTDSYGAGNYDLWLIKVDTGGNLLWQRYHGFAQHEWGESVEPTSDGGYVIAGRTNSIGSGVYDLLFVKTDSLGNLPTVIIEQGTAKPGESRLNVYPNPFLDHAAIRLVPGRGDEIAGLRIYDACGTLVRDLSSCARQPSPCVFWNGRDARGRLVPSGVYWACLNMDGKFIAEKIIKLE